MILFGQHVNWQQQKQDDGFETELKAKEHHNVISINQRSFNSK